MENTKVCIIGASFSGLAAAACLQKENIPYLLIEKSSRIADSWHRHYERLHLHTHKRLSALPFKSMPADYPKYPSRLQVIEYLESYRKEFGIKVQLEKEAKKIFRDKGAWFIETTKGKIKSDYLIMATGAYGKPREVNIKGMDTFQGDILHSSEYKTGKRYAGKKVLVIGFGNSACEIAIDLHEQGAQPAMSVRSPVNVVPREVFGIDVTQLSILNRKLPPKLVDQMNGPLIKLLVGDLNKIGLKTPSYGPAEQIITTGKIPVLDIGTIKLIRKGHVSIFPGVKEIEGNTVHFEDGRSEEFGAIIAGIGFHKKSVEILDIAESRFEDLKFSIRKQKQFGRDGLYFCGFWVSPTGQIREIKHDALYISEDIAKKIRFQT
ncbi:flavin-containing monooxygenase [Pararhodonellum marinum]|uniref:flavin-containing monooxygenase n=1 Tax=Pararhodonellum marinum TaxID=2755358 RepID=UPI00188DF321|nr:NAD(P)/FAD-dependent oxidoreductase [Pararhodonellum marinum]